MKQLRLGIIGVGPIVEKKHLPALAEIPEIAVVALCRRNSQQLHQLADRFRIAKCYGDYRELLEEKEIDAVLIATGPETQPQIVMDAAAAHKHIFAEKPMAESSAEAIQMADSIRTAGIQFQIGFNKRFYYGYRQAKKLVQRGELGRLSGINARFWFQPGRRDALLHNGIHFFDLVLFLMGPVREVFARSAKLSPTDPQGGAPETFSVSMQFESGAVGNLMLSSAGSWDYVNEHVDLIGSNHNVLSVENGRVLRLCRRGEDQPAQLYENTLSVHWWSGNEEQGFAVQLRAFAQNILNGTRPSSSPDDIRFMSAGAEDGISALQLMEAVKSSIAHNSNVSILPLP
ncbi:MAG: Gfo/Idh/MocA family oxidoreductase [Deltaproteobacteria bacterium]|nr:Gfo/Idh/MocA family oxidoreductase [Deltaproteobacteria bacterium]